MLKKVNIYPAFVLRGLVVLALGLAFLSFDCGFSSAATIKLGEPLDIGFGITLSIPEDWVYFRNKVGALPSSGAHPVMVEIFVAGSESDSSSMVVEVNNSALMCARLQDRLADTSPGALAEEDEPYLKLKPGVTYEGAEFVRYIPAEKCRFAGRPACRSIVVLRRYAGTIYREKYSVPFDDKIIFFSFMYSENWKGKYEDIISLVSESVSSE